MAPAITRHFGNTQQVLILIGLMTQLCGDQPWKTWGKLVRHPWVVMDGVASVPSMISQLVILIGSLA